MINGSTFFFSYFSIFFQPCLTSGHHFFLGSLDPYGLHPLQGAVEGINLTPTLMFDYPTVPDLVEYIWSQAVF